MSFRNWFGKAILTNNSETIESFPKQLLDKYEYQVVQYVLDYKNKYGSLPTIDSVKMEVNSYELYLNEKPPHYEIEQLFSEAKKESYTRKTKELLAGALNGGTNDFVTVANEIQKLNKLVLPASKPKDYDDLSVYTIPKTKYFFKYKYLEQAANSLLGGEVALFVGQAKSKKTWITLDLALHAYIKQNKKVYFTSLEMNSQQIQQRVNAMIGGFNPKVFRTGTQDELTDYRLQFEERNRTIKDSTTGSFIIPERMTNTVWDVIRDVEEYEPDIVFIDSIYLFQNDKGVPIQSDWGALATMIGQLKSLAREKDIQIICNSQLKRDAKDDVEADDVAYSSDFVRTCDLVIAVQSDNQPNNERSILKVLASRNGAGGYTGSFIDFYWDTCTIQERLGAFIEKMRESNNENTTENKES